MIIKKYFNILKFYTVSEILAKGLNWLLLIILPKIISVDVFGVIALLVAFENFILPISLNGQNVTILRFLHRFYSLKNSFLKSVLIILLKWNLIIIPLSITIALIFFKSVSFIIIAIIVPMLAIREIVLNYLRVTENTKNYLSIRVTFQLIKFLLVLGLAIFFPNSSLTYPVGLLIATVISLEQIYIKLKDEFVIKDIIKATDKLSKMFFLFGFPIVFHGLSNAIIMFSDRYMIDFFLGKYYIGLYSVAYSISFSLFFILYIGGLIFQPFLYKSKNNNRKSEVYLTLYTNSIFVVIALAAIFMIILFPYLIKLYPNDYLTIGDVFIVLVFTNLFIPFYHQGNYRLTLKNKTQFLPLASASAGVLNIGLNIFFIPKYGIIGAAYSSMFANILLMLIVNLASYSFFRMNNIVIILLLIVGAFIIFIYQEMLFVISYMIIIYIVLSFVNTFFVYKNINYETENNL